MSSPDPPDDRSRKRLLYGTEEPSPARRTLTAGALSADFDQGNIRYVHWGNLEIIRAIAFVVRDTAWGTAIPKISDLAVAETADEFGATYDATVDNTDGIFRYRATIEGKASGSLAFSVSGTTVSGFGTCRTGFIVLHPLVGVVGRAVTVEHAAGDSSVTMFPDLIHPIQPVFDIQQLSHEPFPGVHVTVRMEGDTFEMEDHRNWSDASFKTYVRPLAWGYPYRIEAGQRVQQDVGLSIVGRAPGKRAKSDAGARVTIGKAEGLVPRMGLFLPTAEVRNLEPVAERIADLAPAFIAGRVDLRRSDASRHFAELTSAVARVGVPLALEAVIAGRFAEQELAPLKAMLAESPAKIESLVVFPARDLDARDAHSLPSGEADAATIVAAARRLFQDVAIGGGSPCGFSELNRNRPAADIDFVTHSTAAVYHAADDSSVMETLQSLADIARSTRSIVGTIPYRICPATIALPKDWAAGVKVANPDARRVTMAATDPRAAALFGAAFAMGYASAAAKAGVDMLALAAPTGPFGIVQEGTIAPLAHPIAGLCQLSGCVRLATEVSRAASVAALAAQHSLGPVLWLANLSDSIVNIETPGTNFDFIATWDAETLGRVPPNQIAVRRRLPGVVVLNAYGLCRLSIG